jgi:hypothetical protein
MVDVGKEIGRSKEFSLHFCEQGSGS